MKIWQDIETKVIDFIQDGGDMDSIARLWGEVTRSDIAWTLKSTGRGEPYGCRMYEATVSKRVVQNGRVESMTHSETCSYPTLALATAMAMLEKKTHRSAGSGCHAKE